MAYWLLKTEPGTYSFDDLRREGRTRWEGVKNALALKHLAAMLPGDEVVIYHTGDERAAVGTARVVSEPYPDPAGAGPREVVVDLEAGSPLRQAVTLAAMKKNPRLAGFDLLRLSRLSVVPMTDAHWGEVQAMAR